MKNRGAALLLFIMLLVFSGMTYAGHPFSTESEALQSFNIKRLQINKTGMITLGAWAIGNFVAGGIGWSRSSGPAMYFHQGNVMWNTVNFALAGFGMYGAMTALPGSFSLHQTIVEQYSLEKLLLFNAGLDIGYIATGFFLMERSKHVTRHSDKYKGYGQALILQGSFLFLFDLALFAFQNHHGKALEQLVPVISFAGQGVQFGLGWHF